MKRTVFTFGVISGLVVALLMILSILLFYDKNNMSGSMMIGYASMLIAFAFIFVGIKNYRDKYNGGVVTFGKALQIGLLIAFIASTFYVAAWLVEYYCFMPDFMDKYADHVLKQMQESGASASEIAAQKEHLDFGRKAYKTPIGIILMTYMETLVIGVPIAFIAALALKRKSPRDIRETIV